MEQATSFSKFKEVVVKDLSIPVSPDPVEFQLFDLDKFVGPDASPIPYNRKVYYKLLLIKGHNRFNYADKSIEFDGTVLFTANPMVPYNWEQLGNEHSGRFCVFTEDFLDGFINIKDYPLFRPGAVPIFSLTEEQATAVEMSFNNMSAEIASNYKFKYDLIRTFVLQLIHQAMKFEPSKPDIHSPSNSSERITPFFLDLLERQFPIAHPTDRLRLKSPSDYASSLSVHVNHLNRSLKRAIGKTTSQLIAERTLQEARTLLKQTTWSINNIGFCLGFEEPSHFITFFKRHEKITPKRFRSAKLV